MGRLMQYRDAAIAFASDYRAPGRTSRQLTAERVAQAMERSDMHAKVMPTMAWIDQAVVRTEFKVSVVMPTHNRAVMLSRAINSVLAQSYPNWELLVVDDASTDDTGAYLAGVQEERLRVLKGPGGSAAAARNIALGAVTGDLVVYLDDDNTFHANWFRSVAWAFTRWPEQQWLYAGRVFEDAASVNGTVPSSLNDVPFFVLPRFAMETLKATGLADTNVLAHRAGFAPAHFDTAATWTEDYEMIVRMAAVQHPLVLPVIASFYYTKHQRGSQTEQAREGMAYVRTKHFSS